MGGVCVGVRSRSDEPVSRPTAVFRSPHKSPSLKTGAQLGGARWVELAIKAARVGTRARSNGERCDRFPGAADAHRRPPHSLRVGGSAERVTPSEPKAKRLARGPSRLDHLRPRPSWRVAPGVFNRSVSGMAARRDETTGLRRRLDAQRNSAARRIRATPTD